MITDYHAKYFAHELVKRSPSNSYEKLTNTILDAKVDLNPHQVEAALFASKSPLGKGALLADEVGLGKTIDQLANHLSSAGPDYKGFNRRNLYRMKQFYDAYAENPIVSPLVTQLSWSNHLIILSKTKTAEEREFYIRLSIKEQYTKRELERQINAASY